MHMRTPKLLSMVLERFRRFFWKNPISSCCFYESSVAILRSGRCKLLVDISLTRLTHFPARLAQEAEVTACVRPRCSGRPVNHNHRLQQRAFSTALRFASWLCVGVVCGMACGIEKSVSLS